MPDRLTQTIVATDTALRIIALVLTEGEKAGVKGLPSVPGDPC